MELRCQECNCYMAEVRRGILVLKATHHGREHVTTVGLVELLEEELGKDGVNQIAVEMLRRIW